MQNGESEPVGDAPPQLHARMLGPWLTMASFNRVGEEDIQKPTGVSSRHGVDRKAAQ